MPDATTCEGKLFPTSISPAVTWTAGPTGTMSYAVTFTDLTILATRDPLDNTLYNQGYHYVIWDIPAATDPLGIPANMSTGFEPALATLPIPAVEENGPSFPRLMDDYLKVNALAAAEYRGTSNAQASSIDGVFPPTFQNPCPSEGEPPENCLSTE